MTISTEQVPSEDVETRAAAAERLTFFGDAVIAIALTLLALELPVPEGSTNSALLRSAWADRAGYLAFLISFVVIAAHWRAHHRVFRYVTALNGRLTSLTVYWLLLLVITPFATDVISGHGAFQVRFVFYATVQFAACVLFLLMVREIRRAGLHRTDAPAEAFSLVTRRSATAAAAFLVSVPISFLTAYAYLCWILIPVIGPSALARLRRHGQT
ncbi:TMEM175 family protein [Streptomyces sp. NPDC008092]|uniref:TMEM175 family protein n=1 Tax=Streptomyces sp. NPDC008092 TaxID=3364808 RepID=UPI0036EFB829